MKKYFLSLISFLFVATSSFAIDIIPVTKKCATCHGVKGEKKALNKSKIIRTMSKENFITALKGYKNKSYGGALKNLMYPQAKPLNDEQISALADFYIK